MRIAVAGGTGTLGREVVARGRARGHDVVVMTRSTGVDVVSGSGLDDALRDADAMIDVVSIGSLSAPKSTAFFQSAARMLLASAARADVPHVVAVSIVGIERNPHGYYAGKLAQEAVYESSGAPWTIVRATQFHEFAEQVAGQARLGPVQLAPRARVQPIAAAAVAEHVLTLAESAPTGRVTDIAGPREEQLDAMIRSWAEAGGRRGPVVAVSLPTAQMRGMRQGLALPQADALRLGPTFAEWLAARPQPTATQTG